MADAAPAPPAPAATTPAAPPPLLISAVEAGRLCGISRTTWFGLLSSGRAPRGIRLGRCRRWSVDELRGWIAAGCPPQERWEIMRR